MAVFRHLNEQARRVVTSSQNEARGFKHNYVGTEHMLLGLLHEREGVAAGVLKSLGVTLEPIRKYVILIVGAGEETARGAIPLTPRAKKVLELAMREALGRSHTYIGAEDLLLGLAQEGDGVAARIFLDIGIDVEQIREEIQSPSSTRRGGMRERMVAVDSRVTAAAAFELAAAKAEEEDRPVDLGDLLLALAEEWPEKLVARALEEVRVDSTRLRAAVGAARSRC